MIKKNNFKVSTFVCVGLESKKHHFLYHNWQRVEYSHNGKKIAQLFVMKIEKIIINYLYHILNFENKDYKEML